MLNRNSVRVGFAAMAILFSAALNNNALGQPFAFGDVITYTHDVWGSDPSPGNAAALLQANYSSVYASTFGLLEVGIPGSAGFSMLFTNVSELLGYLPATGVPGPLTSDLLDPSSSASGAFGGHVTALRINIDFSDAEVTLGTLGIPFGDLEFHSLSTLPLLNGLTVRQFSAEVNTLLGGGSGIYSIPQLTLFTDDLNVAFGAGFVTPIALDHLRVVPGIPGDYNHNGVVDAADYVVWRKGLGTTYTQAHYDIWRANFGQTAGSGAALPSSEPLSAAVPEPVSLALLALAIFLSAEVADTYPSTWRPRIND